jgi:hypothetical protein
MVQGDGNNLFVLDVGLKPYITSLDPDLYNDSGSSESDGGSSETGYFLRHIARPAMLYRVNMATGVVKPVIEELQLTYPTDMVRHNGQLYICDCGEPPEPDYLNEEPRAWRQYPHEFGVSVHFSKPLPQDTRREPEEPDQDAELLIQKERREIVHSICDVIELEKPAHTFFTTVCEV